jgi:GGDEF domain-containing protein
MPPRVPPLEPELGPLLARNRERLVRRWLELVVERSSLDELATRPLAERLGELELLFEAASASHPAQRDRRRSDEPLPDTPAHARQRLRDVLERELAEHRRSGLPFSLAVLAAGPGRSEAGDLASAGPGEQEWARALAAVAREGELVMDAGDGNTAVVLPGLAGVEARAAGERLRVDAWRELAWRGRVAGLGLAECPDHGASAHELLAVAYDRLVERGRISDVRASRREPEHGPRPLGPVRPA